MSGDIELDSEPRAPHDQPMYEYLARVERIVDGDTIDVDVDVGFHIRCRVRVRLRGVNTPEVRGEERPQGLAASAFVRERLPVGSAALVRTYKVGKYGRYIADILFVPGEPAATIEALRADAVDLAELLVEHGHAVREDE